MAKRFTDTDKWKKKWFRALSPKMKCAWNYLCDMSDHAGVWEADFELMKTFIGEEVTPQEIAESFPGRVLEVSDGKYLLLGFISFQYKSLKAGNKVHISARERIAAVAPNIDPDDLASYPNLTLNKPLPNPCLTPSEISETLSNFFQRDKETETDKDKETDKEGEPLPNPFRKSAEKPIGRPTFVLEGA
jgi:hypothetical protein